MGKISLWKSALAIAGLAFGLSSASSVAVHDPSVVLVYKDASGNSYPEQDASKSRTKYYYIFGTMGGAAYSKDLINWTEFTPTYLANGTLSTDFSKIVSVGATWSGWTTASDAQTNYWAPDIIWNPGYEWEDGSKGAYMLYVCTSSTWRRSVTVGMSPTPSLRSMSSWPWPWRKV